MQLRYALIVCVDGINTGACPSAWPVRPVTIMACPFAIFMCPTSMPAANLSPRRRYRRWPPSCCARLPSLGPRDATQGCTRILGPLINFQVLKWSFVLRRGEAGALAFSSSSRCLASCAQDSQRGKVVTIDRAACRIRWLLLPLPLLPLLENGWPQERNTGARFGRGPRLLHAR